MVRIWEEKINRASLSGNILKVLPIVLKNQFQGSMERWKSYCCAVKKASSLTGNLERKKDIVWAIQDSTIETLRRTLHPSSCDTNYLSPEDKMFREELFRIATPQEINLWFKDVHLKAKREIGLTRRVILMVFVPYSYMVNHIPNLPIAKAVEKIGKGIDQDYYSYEILHKDHHFEQNHYFS